MTMEPLLLSPAPEDTGQRLDSFLAGHVEGLTRSAAQKLLEAGQVRIGEKSPAKNYKLTP